MKLNERMEVRLSTSELGQLDQVCERYSMSRGAMIRELIRYAHKDTFKD